MPTNNKGLNQPVLGSVGWGTPINENASILDLALGAFEIVSGTSGSFALSATQVQSMCLKSDTASFTSDVTFAVPSGVAGQWLVINQSAASAFSLIVKNDASAQSVSIPSGQSRLVYSDGAGVVFSDYQPSISTQAQAEARTDNATLMTPLRTSQQVQSSISTQVQAETGTDNTTIMTPLRVAQSVGLPNSAPLKSGLNATGLPPIYAARAWAYIESGFTSAPTFSGGNISSIARIGTGQYTFNFITTMPDNEYNVVSTATQGGSNSGFGMTFSFSAKSAAGFSTVYRRSTDHSVFDGSQIGIAVFR